MRWICVMVLAVTTARAWADGDGIAELDKSLTHPAPGAGLDKAPVRAPAWCTGSPAPEQAWAYDVASELQTYRTCDHDRITGTCEEARLFRAARLVCGAPNHPVVQRAAAEIEQLWINETGLAEADAVESLAAHVDKDRFLSEREKLCEALPAAESNVDDRGNKAERRMLALTRRAVFGCDHFTRLWMQRASMDQLGGYVDRGSVERDPFARMAWVLDRQFPLLDHNDRPEKRLVGYVTEQFDLHAVSADAVMRQLDAAPFRGNQFARVVVLESLARMRMRSAQVDVGIAKLTSDPDWKEMLVTVPQRGAAAWLAAADKHKDALARSDDFDRKARASADVHGCTAPLRNDFLAIFKTFKHSDVATVGAQLSDHPIAGLLLARLGQCMQLDGDVRAGLMLALLAREIRVTTGPRVAAYYATIDALAARKRDQRPFYPDQIPQLVRVDVHLGKLHVNAVDYAVIARLDKKPSAVRVSFVQNKFRMMSQECRDGNKIDRIRPDGKVEYRQVCHDAGMVTVDQTPPPRLVPVSLAAGLKPGRVAWFDPLPDDDDERGRRDAPELYVPAVVYTDKSAKRLIAFYGFAFE